MRKIFLIALLFSMVMIGQAQDEKGGTPYSFSAKKLSMNIPQMSLPPVNHVALLEEDAINGKNNPLRISVHQTLHYTMNNSGRLDILDDGSKLWRVNIKSPNAYAVYLHFSSFEIPEGAELFVYTPDREFVRGKYLKKNEGEDFYVLDIPGDEIIVEYYEPAGAAFTGHFEIAYLGHVYRDVFVTKGMWGNAEGKCHLNVMCPEVQHQWQNQVNSVVCIRMLTSQTSYLCSGAIINNVTLNGKPYVYTAGHCYKNAVNNDSYYFYFDYQTTACNTNSGGSGYSARGAVVRAVDTDGGDNMSKGPDFMLLEITGDLPSQLTAHLYFSGWDISTSTPTVGAAVHHPGGDFKKYSKPRQTSSHSSYYWQVRWYIGADNKGVTEQGSSGSPLFNAKGNIVGSLSRGSSACNNTSGTDFYGKLTASWTFKTAADKQLKCWLDPDNTGVTSLSGGYLLTGFVPVTNITNIPDTAIASTPLSLISIVNPSNATNKTIVWSVQSAGTTGATVSGNTLNAKTAGTVTITATITNGKTVDTDYTQDFIIKVKPSASGITELNLSGFTVYPNPTTGKLYVTRDNRGSRDEIEIFDVTGRKQNDVSRITCCETDEITIDISHLSAGVYFLRINGEVVKVMKN